MGLAISRTAFILLLVWVLVLTSGPNLVQAGEPPAEIWSKTYGAKYDAETTSLVQTSDGGYALAGSANFGVGGDDFWLVKTDNSGSVLWNQTYGNLYNDAATCVIQTTDGGYALAGNGFANLVKTDSEGVQQWAMQYDMGSANYVIQTSDGGYAIAGRSRYVNSFMLVKVYANGTQQWYRNFVHHPYEYANSVVQTSDGGYALAGETWSYDPGIQDYHVDSWLIKTDGFGNAQWNETYGGTVSENAIQVVQASDGGYVMAGYIRSPGIGDYFWLTKTDLAGNMEWRQTYGDVGYNWPCRMAPTSDGGYVIVGWSDPSDIGQYNYVLLVKTDSDGNMQWSKRYGEPKIDGWINCVIQTSDDGYALAGSIRPSENASYDFWLMKTDAYGEVPEFPSVPVLSLFMILATLLVFSMSLARRPHVKLRRMGCSSSS